MPRLFQICTFARSDPFGWNVLSILLQANTLCLQGYLRCISGEVVLEVCMLERILPQVTREACPIFGTLSFFWSCQDLAAQKMVSPAHHLPENGGSFALFLCSILEKGFLGMRVVDS